jgi:hypothetical protein
MTCTQASMLRRYRLVLGLFMAGLVFSGITAFPLKYELDLITSVRGLDHAASSAPKTSLDSWLLTVHNGLHDTYSKYPWMAYGTDWLALAHIVIAIFFVGPFREPVRNVWILKAGLIACLLVVPLALICGAIRHIPFGWRLIDCSFGVFGALPLYYCLRLTKRMESGAKAVGQNTVD